MKTKFVLSVLFSVALILVLLYPSSGKEILIEKDFSGKNHQREEHQRNDVRNEDNCVIETPSKIQIIGLYDSEFKTCSFKNIPFGADTSGSRRWQSPLPNALFDLKAIKNNANHHGLIMKATEFGKSCPQQCDLPEGLCPRSDQDLSEDCLNLNVYTPSSPVSSFQGSNQSWEKKLLPVIVFIPGGHFDQGTANCDIYDGRRLVNKSNQVILVVINYRLGSLGFMADQSRGLYGNYGIQDQRLALQWVRRNIDLFGGDPSQVTLVGESAGASSVSTHLISPQSKDLFHKAVLQSTPLSLSFKTLSDASKLGHQFVKLSKCDHDPSVKCLRDLTFQQVIQYQDQAASKLDILNPISIFMPWTPVINQSEVPSQPLEAFQKGTYHKMPMILGTLSEEAMMFVYLAMSKPLNWIEYEALILALFTTQTIHVNQLYPAEHEDKRVDASILGTDYIFLAPTRNATINIAIHNLKDQISSIMAPTSNANSNVYLFQFNHSMVFDGWGERYKFCYGHVCHGSEIPFLFDSAWIRHANFTENEKYISNLMITYWTNFATTGDPNTGPIRIPNIDGNLSATPKWIPFEQSTMYNMQFNTEKSFNYQFLRQKYCDAWDKMGYDFGHYFEFKVGKKKR